MYLSNIPVSHHEGQPAVFEDGREDLPDARCYGNRSGLSSVGFSLAAFWGMRRITPSLRACGTDPVCQHELYRSRSAGSSEGQCFRMLYEMWSRGLGAEDDLHLTMISSTSLCEMWSSLNGMVAGGGCGSQVGLVYDLGLLS